MLSVEGCSLWRAWTVNCVLSAAEANMCDGDQPLTGEYIARARSRRRNIQPVQHQVRYLSKFCRPRYHDCWRASVIG